MKELSFEKALVRLEEIVRQMEAGEVTLEASLALFEEGTALSRHCAGKLDAAEERIRILQDDGEGGIAEQDLDQSASGGGS